MRPRLIELSLIFLYNFNMQEKVLDLDSSKIISAGTVQRNGYLPRITEAVRQEIIRHGIDLSTSTYILDQKTASYSDFTSVYGNNNSVVAIYAFKTGTRDFLIEKFAVGKSSYVSLCGNQNHPAIAMITDTDSGKKYGICDQVEKRGGDFSLVSGYIFYPEDHKREQLELPADKCLGRTLKNILCSRAI